MDRQKWDAKAEHPMQAWMWGEFRQKMGNDISRVVGGQQYQIIWSRVPYSPWWFGYIPMSKLPTESDMQIIKNEAITQRALGVRMEPNVRKQELTEVQRLMASRFLLPGRKLFKPKTFWVDLTKSEKELLEAMHPKTRYNIRLAQKHGVEVRESNRFEDYLRLMFEKTAKRQKIYAHTQTYHRVMYEMLSQAGMARLFAAQSGEKTVATWIIFEWKNFVYYAYGAFDETEREKMAPVLGLWEIIRWAKRQGYKTLDLWGAEEGEGFSRFKEQFGPEPVEMVGCYDLPVRRLVYYGFRQIEEWRWKVLRKLK